MRFAFIIGTYISYTPLCDVLRHNDKEYTLAVQSWAMDNLTSGVYSVKFTLSDGKSYSDTVIKK